ncbi:hypothetical protein [Pleionea litopenaei]|uniref:Uncharacterized protein n=1 Tax=Pleionea litopenaei TaxID=3070815 RepID=A0AA51X5I9_9GAMM|nr:hypothetical protein [Pleionea sp. HL-JVS1]WMS85839.1 hypothetical protein Q9312_11485 [Pleionea sp. HL-JVS1]
MTGRTVPLSVRVSHEDAEFLSSLEIEGAETPSEKLRALITEAKRRQEAAHGFAEAQTELRRVIQPLVEQVQAYESEQEVYSQLTHLALEWIPEAMAELVSQRFALRNQKNDDKFKELERRVTDRIFRLIEGYLRLAVTQDCEGYDPQVVQKRLPRIQQLIKLLQLDAST